MNLAFAGFRHGHIFALYDMAKKNPEVTITGCYEENEPARRTAQETTGGDFCYATYEAVLNDPAVDAIAIGDYYQKRGQLIIQALRHGKHIICDKPLCTSLEELDEIERLAEEKNLQVCCMLDLRYLPQVRKAKELIESGELGEIHNISFTGQHPLDYGNRPAWYFEPGKHGGTINDIAIHGIDLVRLLTGKDLTKVHCARTWNAFADKEPDFPDCAQFMVEMGGTSVMADVSYAAPSYLLPTYWDFYFWGTKGMMNFRLSETTIHLYRSTEEIIDCPAETDEMMADFLKEIGGETTRMATKETLASQRQTLKIQKVADLTRFR